MSRTEGARERTILRDPGVEVGPGILNRTSVTAITGFDATQDGGCPTRSWYEKVDGKKTPTTAAMLGGTDLHAQLERYLKTGEDVLGPLARAGKYLVPAPGPDLLVEHEFKGDPVTGLGLVASGVPLLGYIDLINPRGEYLDNDGELHKDPPGTIEDVDWKTTSDFKWAKAGSALVRTVQMPSYGMYSALKYPNAEFVRLSHVYFLTKGRPQAEKRTALVPLTTIRSRWEQIEGVVREMKDVFLEADVTKVPKNLNACGAYGGCPHAAYCPRPREAILASLMSKGNAMGLLDRLKAAKTETPPVEAPVALDKPKAAPPPVVAVVVAPPVAVVAPPAEGTLARRKRLAAELAEVERLAALEDAEGTDNTDVVDDAEDLGTVVLAKDAKQNATYEGRMEDGSTFRVLFVGRTKAGLTFKRLDKSGGMNLEEDTGLVFVSGPAVSAPIPSGVLPPDAPKPGESGPTFKPFEAGSNAPANVLKAQSEHPETIAAKKEKAVQDLPVVVTGVGSAPPPQVVAGGKRFRRTAEEIAAGLSVEQAQAARVKADAVSPALIAAVRQNAALPEVIKAFATPQPKPPYVDDSDPRAAMAEVMAAAERDDAAERSMERGAEHAQAEYDALHRALAEANAKLDAVKLEVKAKAANPIVPAPVDPDAEYEALVTKVDPSRPFTLFLDIAAVKGVPVNDLSKLVDECSGAVAKQYGVIDVRAAGSNSEIGFGKWKGHLHALISENAPKSGSWSLTGVRESEIRQVAAEALASKASVVFRPVG